MYDVAKEMLPGYWACYLMYGDATGLTELELEEVDAWLDNHPEYGCCLTVEGEPGLQRFNGLLTEVMEYHFPVSYPAHP